FVTVVRPENVQARIKQQPTTALRQPPITWRVYQGAGDPAELEKRLHKALDAADHNPNRAKGAGKEWFLTNLKFLDAVAAMLDLEIHRYHEDMTTELET
ncbi:MAG: GIY-YIG nuclease family protein, partial [Gammaproteobacteria bacterium]|nr:GIY-YIG nuclease family protein [Gammaproteobacteria bacterium]